MDARQYEFVWATEYTIPRVNPNISHKLQETVPVSVCLWIAQNVPVCLHNGKRVPVYTEEAGECSSPMNWKHLEKSVARKLCEPQISIAPNKLLLVHKHSILLHSVHDLFHNVLAELRSWARDHLACKDEDVCTTRRQWKNRDDTLLSVNWASCSKVRVISFNFLAYKQNCTFSIPDL